MDERKKMEQAKAAYETLCQTLDSHQWKYNKIEGELAISCGVQGEDLLMDIKVKVDADKMIVLLISHLPVVVPENKRLDVAIAVSVINDELVHGCFDYDVTSGHIFFRMTNSFMESKMSEAMFTYMLYCSSETIDEYNDKLLMLAKGMLSMEQFLSDMAN